MISPALANPGPAPTGPAFTGQALLNSPKPNQIVNNMVGSAMHSLNDTQPQMMSFKQFLQTLNSEAGGTLVSNEVANSRYNEYKIQFRREQVQAFFNAHKNEEWFKFRYHPEDSVKRKDEQRESVKNRLNIFLTVMKLYHGEETDETGSISLEMSDDFNRTCLFRLLDACLVRLEDGSEQDVSLLERFAYFTRLYAF
jgi:hypothetical protein